MHPSVKVLSSQLTLESPRVHVGTRLFCHRRWLVAGKNCCHRHEWSVIWSTMIFRSGFCRWCRSPCWATRTCACTWDDGIRSCISRARAELAEDKSPNFGQQGGLAIHSHSVRAGGCSGWEIYLSLLTYQLINSKLSWYLMLKCHHSCGNAKSRQTDLEVENLHFNQDEAVQYMHPTYLPVWLWVTGSHQERCAQDWCSRSMTWKLLGIKWYHHVQNDEVRRTTGQPHLSATVQARRLSLCGHIVRMPDERRNWGHIFETS